MQLLIIYSIALLLREGTDNNKGSCVVHRRMLLLPRGQRESGVEIVYYELMKSIFNVLVMKDCRYKRHTHVIITRNN